MQGLAFLRSFAFRVPILLRSEVPDCWDWRTGRSFQHSFVTGSGSMQHEIRLWQHVLWCAMLGTGEWAPQRVVFSF